jgi:hypothetical protein
MTHTFIKLLKHLKKIKIGMNVFDIPQITIFDVRKIIDSLKISKAAGIDNIGAKILKYCGDTIVCPITSIINNCINAGIFPDQLKDAYVLPIHKGADKSDLNNYRPISILPTISKIFERHITNQLKSYLDKHELLHSYQSGFRQNHSCQTSLIRLVDSWLQYIDSGRMVGSIFLDLRKAFDLVDHDILLEKLSMYHFSDNALALMKSYLSNRRQCIKIGSRQSSFQYIKTGVPQGSILGPILFLIYINDIPSFVKNSTIDLYADDSTLHVSDYNIHNIQLNLQNDLDRIATWCSFNNMSIHPNKTKCMLLSKARCSTDKLRLNINGILLEQTKEFNLLGVTIDEHLTWQSHINSVCRKLNFKLALLKRINYFINYETKKLFYNSYILTTMDYCCALWCSATQSHLRKIHSIQKRAAKIILNKPYSTPSAPLFKELGWLTFNNRCTFLTGSIVHKFVIGAMPSYFNNVIHISNNNVYALRSITHTDISSIPFKTNYGKRAFSFRSRTIWNSIPISIRQVSSNTTFKIKFKEYLQTNH